MANEKAWWRDEWFVPKTIQQAQYMNKVNQATIPGQVKDFCRYVASKATWKHTTKPENSYYPCYATHDTIEIEMGRSTQYVSDAKKMALQLGWAQVLHRPGTSDLIWPALGVDDESIPKREKRERWERGDDWPVDDSE